MKTPCKIAKIYIMHLTLNEFATVSNGYGLADLKSEITIKQRLNTKHYL